MIKNQNDSELSIVEKYMLMLLYAHEGKCKGNQWFQKEMFELAKAFKELAEELDFTVFDYGPYSEALDKYKDMLENSGFIKDLSLTNKGYEVAKQLWEDFKDKEIIKATSEFLESLDEDELLLYIYVTSPESAEKSDVKEEIMRRRKEISLKMLKEKKISLGLAAKLAGLSYFEMLDEAIKHGIKPFEVKGDV
jgi:predicted HTH domain antitoxin